MPDVAMSLIFFI